MKVLRKDISLLLLISLFLGSLFSVVNINSASSMELETPVFDTESFLRTVSFSEGPLNITIDESKYNILTRGMKKDDPAVIRTGYSAEDIETLMGFSDQMMVIYDQNESYPAEMEIALKIKDNKYKGVDLRELSEKEVESVMDSIFASDFASYGAVSEGIKRVNGVPYYTFTWMAGKEYRYATIVNGDMIYIYVQHTRNQVTNADKTELEKLVETIDYSILQVDIAEPVDAQIKNPQINEKLYDQHKSGLGMVYADIVSIEPYYYISNSSGYGMKALLCESTTSEGKKIWVYIEIKDYAEYFDSAVYDYLKDEKLVKTIRFSPATRIHGFVKSTSSISLFMAANNFFEDIVFAFKSMDKPEQ